MPENPVTRILQEIEDGTSFTSEELLPLLYAELRKLAARRLAREKPGQTLQPTALVQEAYLRLVGDREPRWSSRGHFFGAAALAMRRILVERARRYGRKRHGGGQVREPLDIEAVPHEEKDVDYLALDDSLRRMEDRDPVMHQVVMLRFFAGLSVEDTAAAMGISPRTVKREWATARTVLYMELSPSDDSEGPKP